MLLTYTQAARDCSKNEGFADSVTPAGGMTAAHCPAENTAHLADSSQWNLPNLSGASGRGRDFRCIAVFDWAKKETASDPEPPRSADSVTRLGS
jgi:hypothetical protein